MLKEATPIYAIEATRILIADVSQRLDLQSRDQHFRQQENLVLDSVDDHCNSLLKSSQQLRESAECLYAVVSERIVEQK